MSDMSDAIHIAVRQETKLTGHSGITIIMGSIATIVKRIHNDFNTKIYSHVLMVLCRQANQGQRATRTDR